MNTAETIAYYQGLTKRQLFKAYRDAVTHLNECNVQYNTGHDYLHGERIVQYQREAQNEVYLIKQVLDGQIVPGSDDIIPRFTISQRSDFIRARNERYEKTSLENTIARKKQEEAPLINAMQNLQDFIYNYPHGFIEKIWDGNIATHLKSKFLGFYAQHGPRGVMSAFIAELDTEKKNQLFSFIICYYKK